MEQDQLGTSFRNGHAHTQKEQTHCQEGLTLNGEGWVGRKLE